MTKLWLIICGILSAVALYWYFIANHRQNKIYSLETQITELKTDIKQIKREKDACNDKIKQFNKAQSNANEKIETIRTVIKTVKADCDCYNARLPDDIIKLLHK